MQETIDRYSIKGIPAPAIPYLWKHGEAFIKRALDHANGELEAMDVRAFCEQRNMQLWLIAKNNKVVGAATTELVIFPRKKVCRIVTLAGKQFDEWSPEAMDMVKAWAASQGCDGIEVYVRKGFVPKLKAMGFRETYTVMYTEARS